MSKKVFIVIVFFHKLIWFSALSQPIYFNNLYPLDDNILTTLATAMIKSEQNYIVVGQTLTTIDRQIMLIKINAQGDTIWQRWHATPPNIYYAVEIAEGANGIYIAGSVTDTAGDNNFDFFLSKFDTSGNNQWLYRYGDNQRDVLNYVLKLNDDGFLMAGETQSFGVGGKDFYLVKTDSLGNQQWQKTYGGGGR